MIAYSSVAQIGYVFMGLSMGTQAGTVAAIFHMLVHAIAKPALFISAAAMTDASGEHKSFHFLRGAAYREKAAGIAFTIASMSMVGIPLTAGFISKVRLSTAGMSQPGLAKYIILFALALSTLLNAVYFLQTVVHIYRRPTLEEQLTAPCPLRPMRKINRLALLSLSALTIILGILSGPIIQSIFVGLLSFS